MFKVFWDGFTVFIYYGLIWSHMANTANTYGTLCCPGHFHVCMDYGTPPAVSGVRLPPVPPATGGTGRPLSHRPLHHHRLDGHSGATSQPAPTHTALMQNLPKPASRAKSWAKSPERSTRVIDDATVSVDLRLSSRPLRPAVDVKPRQQLSRSDIIVQCLREYTSYTPM